MGELDLAVPLEPTTTRRSFLFYGPVGSGKTWHAIKMALASARKSKKKILIADVDEKADEMEYLLSQLGADIKEHVLVWNPNEPLTGDEIIISRSPDPTDIKIGNKIEMEPRGLRRYVTLVNELLALARKDKDNFPFDYCITDSWTRICDHTIRKVMYDHKVAFMSERLWGICTSTLIATLSGFMQLPCNRIVIAHERHRIIRDKATDTIRREDIRPMSIGQTSDTMGQQFSEIYYFKGKNPRNDKYQIQTFNDSLLYARTSRGLADVCDIEADGTLSTPKK